jgi:hypothetical protein
MPSLSEYIPNLRRYLLEYPAAQLPNSSSFLYWQETRFGLKPTIRISHLVTTQGQEDTIVASKMLYASHYFLDSSRTAYPYSGSGPRAWLLVRHD